MTGLLRAAEPEQVTPGVLGFLVVAALAVVTWLLIRSMNRQIRRIDLPDEGPAAGTAQRGGPDVAGPDDEPGDADDPDERSEPREENGRR